MDNKMVIRTAGLSDIPLVAQLQLMLWPDHTLEEMKLEMQRVVASPDGVIFIAFINRIPAGFAECRLRHDYVEGTQTSPVGYLEGIFVRSEYRRQGIARKLFQYCEKWAKDKGCSEFASDCEVKNTESIAFHSKAGFTEINRIVCFSKKINQKITCVK
jgi:aminoglycoside 6'-N-acetyltransferase I